MNTLQLNDLIEIQNLALSLSSLSDYSFCPLSVWYIFRQFKQNIAPIAISVPEAISCRGNNLIVPDWLEVSKEVSNELSKTHCQVIDVPKMIATRKTIGHTDKV